MFRIEFIILQHKGIRTNSQRITMNYTFLSKSIIKLFAVKQFSCKLAMVIFKYLISGHINFLCLLNICCVLGRFIYTKKIFHISVSKCFINMVFKTFVSEH